MSASALLTALVRVGLSALICAAAACRTAPLPRTAWPEPWPEAPQTGSSVRVKHAFTVRPGFQPPVGTLRGRVWDLGGATVDGRDAGPCNDDEDGACVTLAFPGLTVRNGAFCHWPDGVKINAPGIVLENLTLENCEDCLNTGSLARSWHVRRCRFRASLLKCTHENGLWGDKAIQANNTSGFNVVEDCVFVDFQNAIRCGLGKQAARGGTVVCRRNAFHLIGTAVHARTGITKIFPATDVYDRTEKRWREEAPGRLEIVGPH